MGTAPRTFISCSIQTEATPPLAVLTTRILSRQDRPISLSCGREKTPGMRSRSQRAEKLSPAASASPCTLPPMPAWHVYRNRRSFRRWRRTLPRWRARADHGNRGDCHSSSGQARLFVRPSKAVNKFALPEDSRILIVSDIKNACVSHWRPAPCAVSIGMKVTIIDAQHPRDSP